MKKLLNLEHIVQSSLPLKNRERWIYFLIDNSEVVYVWSTDDFERRLLQHASWYWKNKKKFDRYFFIWVKSDPLIPIENEYILLLNPKYNKKLNPSNEYITRKTALSEYWIWMTLIKRNIKNIRMQSFKSDIRYNLGDLLKIPSN